LWTWPLTASTLAVFWVSSHIAAVLSEGGDAVTSSTNAGSNADEAIPGMRAHPEGCPACHEDHISLRSFVQSDSSESR
jgi:hypothetical protein